MSEHTHPRVHLPVPAPEARAHSAALRARIVAEIEAAGGWLSFARYMELALYAPGLGYYAGGAAKFGAAGDFVTAPELTPLFGQTLARVAAEVLAQVGADGEVLELGAGSGRLARDVLRALQALHRLPARYAILEPSPDLRERQEALLARDAPDLLPRVHWLDVLPARMRGLVLANEVFDALPARVLRWTVVDVVERGVAVDEQGAFVWAERALDDAAVRAAAQALPVAPGAGADYVSELSLAAPALLASLGERLDAGALLCIDYGFSRAEYYHPQRVSGTLKAHYRHHSLDDPFFWPGLTDLTTHVDFSALAQAGAAAGLSVLGYTAQGRFLLDAGVLEVLAACAEPGSPAYARAAAAAQTLLQPHEMGELFKVMVLGRGIRAPAACRRIDRL